MGIKKIISKLLIIMVFIISLTGCSAKSTKQNFIEGIIEEKYVISAFDNNKGVIKANLTGNLSKQSLEDIVKEIYSKSQKEKIKENEIILNVYKDGENKEFIENVNDNLIFNVDISLEKGIYTLKSVNEVKSVDIGDEIGDFTNSKLISAKDNNIQVEIDMNLEKLDEEEVLKRMKTYADLFLNTNYEKDIKSINLTVNSEGNKSYVYDTQMEETLIIAEKELKILE